IAGGSSNRGLAFVSEIGASAATPPMSIYALALASAWRFGFQPHVVSFGRGPVANLFPKEGDSDSGRSIILVESVTALWDATQADALDAIVGYAYRSLTPLFIDLRVVGKGADGQ